MFEDVPLDVGSDLELKDTNITADAVEIIVRYDYEVIISSFRPNDIVAARDAGAAVVASLLYIDADAADELDTTEALNLVDELACSYVHLHVHLCLDTDIV